MTEIAAKTDQKGQTSPKRIILFVHYDNGGKVDPHVCYLLSAFAAENVSIIFISTSPLDEDGKKAIKPYVLEWHELPNRGYDWNAWRTVLLEKGKDYFGDYDEIILMNDSCYGPVFPLKEVFEKFDRADCDFYGITESKNFNDYPDHIQSYFIGIKKRVFSWEPFWEFFRKLNVDGGYFDVVRNCEAAFSQLLYKNGFASFAFCPVMGIEPEPRLDFLEQLAFTSVPFLLREQSLPFIKIKAFANGLPGVSAHYGKTDEIFSSLASLASPYPIQLIEAHLRRTKPLSWHKNIPGTLVVLDNSHPSPIFADVKIAVFAHLYFEDELDCISALANIPTRFDLVATTPTDGIIRNLEQACQRHNLKIGELKIKKVENLGRDVLPWLDSGREEIGNYDIALKFKDKKSGQTNPAIASQWKDHLKKSLLGSRANVAAILNIFEKNPNVGIVFPAYPPVFILSHPRLNGHPSNEIRVKEVIARCGVSPIEETFTYIFPVGNEFWYRPAALKPLFTGDFKKGDFPPEPVPPDGTIMHGLERAIPYVAQASGYEYRLVMANDDLVSAFQKYEDYMLRRDGVVVNGIATPHLDGVPLRQQLYDIYRQKFPAMARATYPLARGLYRFCKKLSV